MSVVNQLQANHMERMIKEIKFVKVVSKNIKANDKITFADNNFNIQYFIIVNISCSVYFTFL